MPTSIRYRARGGWPEGVPLKTAKILPFRAKLTPTKAGPQRGPRTGWLTPYEVENLFAEALWAGRGATLEVQVPARAGEDGLAWARSRLERLRRRGIEVRVGRDRDWEYREPDASRRS
jgi:hypothetical protein